MLEWFNSKRKEWLDWIDDGLKSNDDAIRQRLISWSEGEGQWAAWAGAAADMAPTFATQCGLVMTDILRLGEGAQEGGLRGWGADGLRLLSVVPVGRLARWMRLTNAARIAQEAARPYCTYVALPLAENLVRGRQFYTSVAEWCTKIGMPGGEITAGGASAADFSKLLTTARIPFKLHTSVASVPKLVELVKSTKGVFVVGLDTAPGMTIAAHTITAFWDTVRNEVVFIGREGKVSLFGDNLKAVRGEFQEAIPRVGPAGELKYYKKTGVSHQGFWDAKIIGPVLEMPEATINFRDLRFWGICIRLNIFKLNIGVLKNLIMKMIDDHEHRGMPAPRPGRL